ncbi:MAG: ABC transporter ATP-binding protein [Pseudomonadota bacterium]
MDSMALLKAVGVSKAYTDMSEPVWVLRDLDFEIGRGELVGIFGASGAGKSTFLHVLGGIDHPSSGAVYAGGNALRGMKADDLARFRNRGVGFVFQFYHLLAEFTALENVMLPALIAGISKREAAGQAGEALEAMGLSARANHRPAMLSGGEQQRVALARAAVLQPPVILADEPTGNLDHETGDQVFEYLLGLNRKSGMALVIVTHNRDLLKQLPKAYELKDGKLHEIWR